MKPARGSAWILPIACALFVVSVWPTLHYAPLGLDDRAMLASLERAGFAQIWGYDHFGHLRPLKSLYFWLLAQHPGLLATLRVLNVLAALGCAWLLRRLVAAPLQAAVAASLWLLNPTTVAGVAWLSASNYLFALFGSLLYVLALESARPRFILGHLALLFAALHHELAALTPLWLLLCGRRDHLLGAAAVWALPIALRLLHTAPVLAYRSQLPPLQLAAAAAYNLGLNVRLWLWLQDSFGVLLSQTAALPAALCVVSWLAALVVGVLVLRLREPRVHLAAAWVLLFLAPLVNLVPLGNTPVAMHYLIFPGVGLAWLAAWALCRMERSLLTLGLSAALIIGWQPAFRQSVRAFESELTLYEASERHYPDNFEVRVNLISANLRAGRMARAQSLLEEALARAPDHPALLENQLAFFMQTERLDAVLAWFDRNAVVVQEKPGFLVQKGLALLRLGRAREAEPVFEEVLARAAGAEVRVVAGYQLANLWVQAGRLPRARALLQKLHDEQPEQPDITRALRMIDDALRP
jgi:tetratricopeptide (TPR) repeat protein